MKHIIKNLVIIVLALCWIALILSRCGNDRRESSHEIKTRHSVSATQEPEPTPSPSPMPSPTPKPTPTPTPKPIAPEVLAMTDRNDKVFREMQERSDMMGRLLIPSAGIDVALFSDGAAEDDGQLRQAICDAQDSAAIYPDRGNIVIADHNNQGFATLPWVQNGDMAYILRGTSILSLRCYMVMDGINTGKGITDMDGHPANYYSEYLCYTCLEDWTHVRVVCFDEVDEDFFD